MSKLLNEAEVRKLIPIGHSNVLRTEAPVSCARWKSGGAVVSDQAVADYLTLGGGTQGA